jgi:hypothetical protein
MNEWLLKGDSRESPFFLFLPKARRWELSVLTLANLPRMAMLPETQGARMGVAVAIGGLVLAVIGMIGNFS